MFSLRIPFFNVDGGGGWGTEGATNPLLGDEVTSQDTSGQQDAIGEGQLQGDQPLDGHQQGDQQQLDQQQLDQQQLDQQQEYIDFSGRKVPVVDPILKDIHKDYTSLQSIYTQTSQRLKDLEVQNQTLMQLVQQFQQQPQQQPQPAQPSPEELEQMKEDFMNKFYEDPMGAIGDLLQKQFEQQFEQKIKPIVEPLAKEREGNNQIQELSRKYNDFNQMIEPMKQVLQEMPHLAEQGLETVYFVAKGRTAQSTATPSPEQLLNDPNFVNQHVVNNPQIQQKIIGQYLSQKQKTNNQTPPVMGSQPGGQPPAMPQDRPTTLSEGSKMWLRQLGL